MTGVGRTLRALSIALLCLTLCLGCAKQYIIDKIGIVVAMGYDRPASKQSQERIRTTIISYSATESLQQNSAVTSATNHTSKGVRTKLNLKMNDQEVIGQVRVILYGEPLARQGIITLTDTLQRDSEIGTNAYLAVAKTSAEKVMSSKYKKQVNVGEFLFELIRKNESYGIIPPSSLNDFLNAYYRQGRDPILPYLEELRDEVKVAGLALMKNDRMVGLLDMDESLLLKSLMGRNKFDSFEIELPAKELKRVKPSAKHPSLYITLSNLRTKPEIRLADAKQLVFEVNLQIKGQLKEISRQINLEDSKTLHEIEQLASRKLTQDYEKLIKRLQRLQVDPLGFGSAFRSSVRMKDFSSGKWRTMYKTAKFRIRIKAMFTNVGIKS